MYWHVNPNKGNVVEVCGRTTGKCPWQDYESYEEALFAKNAHTLSNDQKAYIEEMREHARNSRIYARSVATDSMNPFGENGLVTACERMDELAANGWGPEWQNVVIPVNYPHSHENRFQYFLEREPFMSTSGDLYTNYTLHMVDTETGESKSHDLGYDSPLNDEFTGVDKEAHFVASTMCKFYNNNPDSTYDIREVDPWPGTAIANHVLESRVMLEDEAKADFGLTYLAEEDRFSSIKPQEFYRLGAGSQSEPGKGERIYTMFRRGPLGGRLKGDIDLSCNPVRPSSIGRYIDTHDGSARYSSDQVDIDVRWFNNEGGSSKNSWALQFQNGYNEGHKYPGWSVITKDDEGEQVHRIDTPEQAEEFIRNYTTTKMPRNDYMTAGGAGEWASRTMRQMEEVLRRHDVSSDRLREQHDARIERIREIDAAKEYASQSAVQKFSSKMMSLFGG
jgi:hypothetical protein